MTLRVLKPIRARETRKDYNYQQTSIWAEKRPVLSYGSIRRLLRRSPPNSMVQPTKEDPRIARRDSIKARLSVYLAILNNQSSKF